MERFKLNKWQKIGIAICGTGFLCSLLLFVPSVQNFALDFGENVLAHRPLTREVWIERFVEWGIELCVLFCITGFIVGFWYKLYKVTESLNDLLNRCCINEFFFPTIIFLGLVLRFFVMTWGNNFDFESYLIVGEIVKNHGNVYAETSRYNYGPIFFFIQGFLYRIACLLPDYRTVYRVLMVSFLSMADLGITLYIKNKTNVLYATIFFLNPISVIITGYHNQFDNWAVLLALIGTEFAMIANSNSEKEQIKGNDICAIVFFALSLIMKHIIYAFPLWILLSTKIPKKKKVLYAFVPPVLFAISFLPFIAKGFDGILRNVFLYKSFNNFPLLGIDILRKLFPSWGGIHHALVFFVLLMFIGGCVFRKQDLDKLMFCYLICLVCFSSAIANQYLVIPLVAVIILLGKKSWVYIFVGGVYLSLESNGLHILNNILEIKFVSDGFLLHRIFTFLGSSMMYSLLVWILLGDLICIIKASRKDFRNFQRIEV